MEHDFDSDEQCLLSADSLMKKSKGFLLFTFDDAGGNYVLKMLDLDYMQQLGLFAYAIAKCQIELKKSTTPLNNDDENL